MKLTTDRCLIRNLTMEDAEDLYYVLSDERVMAYVEPAFDMERTKDFIQTAGLCEPPLIYAIVWKKTGKVIGHVIFHAYEPYDYEIGWIIGRDHWGLGIADEVTKELIKYAGVSGISSCIIECDMEQEASKRIALKNGFVYKGKRGNLELYQLVL